MGFSPDIWRWRLIVPHLIWHGYTLHKKLLSSIMEVSITCCFRSEQVQIALRYGWKTRPAAWLAVYDSRCVDGSEGNVWSTAPFRSCISDTGMKSTEFVSDLLAKGSYSDRIEWRIRFMLRFGFEDGLYWLKGLAWTNPFLRKQASVHQATPLHNPMTGLRNSLLLLSKTRFDDTIEVLLGWDIDW